MYLPPLDLIRAAMPQFAALAHATGAILISRDDHLLQQRKHLGVTVLAPAAYWNRYQKKRDREG